MLLERRTKEDLEEVLQVRLDYLRERRGTKNREQREPTAGAPQTTGRSGETPTRVIDIEGRPQAQTRAEKEAEAKAAKKKKK